MFTIVQYGFEALVYSPSDELLVGKEIDAFYHLVCNTDRRDIDNLFRLIQDDVIYKASETYIGNTYTRSRNEKDNNTIARKEGWTSKIACPRCNNGDVGAQLCDMCLDELEVLAYKL